MKKVLVIEVMDFHAEVFPVYSGLLPQVFKDNLEFHYLVSPQRFFEMPDIGGTVHLLEPAWRRKLISKSGLRKPYYKRLLLNWVQKLQPDLVIFNTIETNDQRFLPAIKAIAADLPCFITMHSAKHPIHAALHGNPSIKLFCLNRYNYDFLQGKYHVDGYFSCLYPAYPNLLPKSVNGRSWQVVIPGVIDFKRRDYLHLIELAKQHPKSQETLLNFIVLGDINSKGGRLLLEKIQAANVVKYFTLLEHRPNDSEFAQRIADADLVLPLLATDSYYTEGSISGSMGHSGAYRKPLMLQPEMAKHLQLQPEQCFIYSDAAEFYVKLQGLNYDSLLAAYRCYLEEGLSDNIRLLRKAVYGVSNLFEGPSD